MSANATHPSETWKPVPGFEGLYEISDFGRVRSLDRVVECYTRWGGTVARTFKGRDLRAYTNQERGGYRYVNLHDDVGQHMCRVAVLVALAFIGPRPGNAHVCHNNGQADDDRADNLRYDSPMNNAADQVKHGTRLRGETAPSAKLTVSDILAIRASEDRTDKLALRFGVSRGHINQIRCRGRWAHV